MWCNRKTVHKVGDQNSISKPLSCPVAIPCSWYEFSLDFPLALLDLQWWSCSGVFAGNIVRVEHPPQFARSMQYSSSFSGFIFSINVLLLMSISWLSFFIYWFRFLSWSYWFHPRKSPPSHFLLFLRSRGLRSFFLSIPFSQLAFLFPCQGLDLYPWMWSSFPKSLEFQCRRCSHFP